MWGYEEARQLGWRVLFHRVALRKWNSTCFAEFAARLPEGRWVDSGIEQYGWAILVDQSQR